MSELNTPLEPAEAGVELRRFWMLFGHAIVFASLGIFSIVAAAPEIAHTLGR